jgi:hypothetical protein
MVGLTSASVKPVRLLENVNPNIRELGLSCLSHAEMFLITYLFHDRASWLT